MTDTGASLQPAIAGTPENIPTPNAYCSPAAAQSNLLTRYGLTPPVTILEGHVLSASMALDREAPFVGIKLLVEQEREWPRTFRYGYPNIMAAPSPVLALSVRAGAWYLNYEGVIPQQVIDWVSLECYRTLTLPFDREVMSESVTGASVHYGPARGAPGWTPSRLDDLQFALIQPFLIVEGHTAPFINYADAS